MKYLLMCAGLLFTVFQSWGQERLADRIAPPSGYVRETCSDNSFTTYLRNLSLLPKGSKVLLYNGKEKANQAAAFAVVDMEIGNRDLSAVIRFNGMLREKEWIIPIKLSVTISIWFLCMPELPLYLVSSQLCFILPCNPGMSLLKAVHPVML